VTALQGPGMTSPGERVRFEIGAPMPDCPLKSTSGDLVNLSEVTTRAYLLFYAIALPPELAISDELDNAYAIRAATKMLSAFSEAIPTFIQDGINVYGISVQTSAIQLISAETLNLRFPLLSDVHCAFARITALPMIRIGRRKRFPVLAVEINAGVIERILQPEDVSSLDRIRNGTGRKMQSP
jgi:peroxiredoxin